MCMTCGKIGCCDSSANKHATAHGRESGHPIIRSTEPGEDWSWCYIDEVAFALAPQWAPVGSGIDREEFKEAWR
jgi:Zn-finger in ubiquitin-hydrolases and other protein